MGFDSHAGKRLSRSARQKFETPMAFTRPLARNSSIAVQICRFSSRQSLANLIPRPRCVHEVEVEVVKPDLAHGGLELLERLIVGLRLGRQLRGDIDLLARNVGVAHRSSNRRLVVVSPGRIEVAVADPQGVSDGVVALVALLEQPGTEPDLGNRVSVAEGVGLGKHAHRCSNSC